MGLTLRMDVHYITSKTPWITALNIPPVFQKHLEEELNQKTLKLGMDILSHRRISRDGRQSGRRGRRVSQMVKIEGGAESLDRVTEMRRKRSLRNSEDSIARMCEGQRKRTVI